MRRGTLTEFWDSTPSETAACLGMGPYAPKETARKDESKFPHAVNDRDLIRQRVLHAKDPDKYPAPSPVAPTMKGQRRTMRALGGGN